MCSAFGDTPRTLVPRTECISSDSDWLPHLSNAEVSQWHLSGCNMFGRPQRESEGRRKYRDLTLHPSLKTCACEGDLVGSQPSSVA